MEGISSCGSCEEMDHMVAENRQAVYGGFKGREAEREDIGMSIHDTSRLLIVEDSRVEKGLRSG